MQSALVSQVDALLADESGAMGTERVKDIWQGLLVNPSGGKDIGGSLVGQLWPLSVALRGR